MIETLFGPENVEDLINFIEFFLEETSITKRGILESAKKGFSEKLAVAKDSILDERADEQEIFSFWTISKMQRLELLNHNHVHKHWKLVEALRKKNLEEKALVETQNEQKREENRLNEVVSPVEAARRTSEYIKKDRKAKNDI